MHIVCRHVWPLHPHLFVKNTILSASPSRLAHVAPAGTCSMPACKVRHTSQHTEVNKQVDPGEARRHTCTLLPQHIPCMPCGQQLYNDCLAHRLLGTRTKTHSKWSEVLNPAPGQAKQGTTNLLGTSAPSARSQHHTGGSAAPPQYCAAPGPAPVAVAAAPSAAA